MDTFTDPDKGILFASAEPGSEISLKDIQAVRAAATGFQTSLNGLVDFLDEPLRSKFLEVKGQINTMLAGLPETDKVPAAQETNYILRQLLSAFQSAQQMIVTLSDVAKTAKGDLATARNSIPTEVTAAIDAKVKGGELITKDQAKKNIDDAISVARGAWQIEIKAVSDRRTSLASANLPVPSDEVLAGKDEDFTAKKQRATDRIAKLKGFSLSSARVTELAWQVEDSAFNSALELATEVSTGKVKAGGGNPFVAPTTPPAAKTVRELGAF